MNLVKNALKDALGFLGLLGPTERMLYPFTPRGRSLMQKHQRYLPLYRQFVRRADLCFDVGANFGSRIEVFLALGARVVAVEPQDSCMRYLYQKYRYNRRVSLVHSGLDEKPGLREMVLSVGQGTSSMMPEWIAAVQQSGRMPAERWTKKHTVAVTTLDDLIARYGMPAFCKIDVEGFEYQVLRGLSAPIPALSFEYSPEYLAPASSAIAHLAALGSYQFNVSIGETMVLHLPKWLDSGAIIEVLSQLPKDSAGDVYARCQELT